MRASGWREFFEGALPESRVVTPATRHTPTRSLGGAETGRSAMNGNDGPFACAACKLVFEHQNAAAHSCKQCKLPVHSWVACDMVWMPEEGEYFCGKPCLEAYTRATTPAACAARAPCRSASGSTRLWSPRPRVALEAECRHDRIVRTATCKPCLLALVASAHGAVRVLEQAVRAAGGAGPWE